MEGLPTTPDLPDTRPWRFVRWTLLPLAAACVAIAVFNALIDPSGQLGTGVLDPRSHMTRDRAAKAAILESVTRPELVVLGTSRAKELDPRNLDRESERPVNAAVVGGDLFEDRVFAAWLGERADADRLPFPHLVVGLDIEGFRGSSLRLSGLLGVPQVRAVARREAGEPSILDLLPEAGQLLLSADVTHASYRTMRQQLRQRRLVAAHLRREDATMSVDDFDTVGMPRATRPWLDADRVQALTRRTATRLTRASPAIARPTGQHGARLDPQSVADLRALVAKARTHHDVPLVFIPLRRTHASSPHSTRSDDASACTAAAPAAPDRGEGRDPVGGLFDMRARTHRVLAGRRAPVSTRRTRAGSRAACTHERSGLEVMDNMSGSVTSEKRVMQGGA